MPVGGVGTTHVFGASLLLISTHGRCFFHYVLVLLRQRELLNYHSLSSNVEVVRFKYRNCQNMLKKVNCINRVSSQDALLTCFLCFFCRKLLC